LVPAEQFTRKAFERFEQLGDGREDRAVVEASAASQFWQSAFDDSVRHSGALL
jgi:hypothetical protein